MKKILLYSSSLLALLGGTGCGSEGTQAVVSTSARGSPPAGASTQQLVPDDTDDTLNGRPSGLTLYTDFGTGCQYLALSKDGALTPRLETDGRPACREELKRKQQ